MTRTCPICGEEFDDAPRAPGRPKRYCSPRCRNIYNVRKYNAKKRRTGSEAWRRETRLCIVCGEEFEPSCNRQRYCSPKCRNLIKRGRILALRARRRIEARKPKVCPGCGEEFMPSHGRQKFCSPACMGRTVKRLWREKHRPPRVIAPRTCPTCGKEFTPPAKHPEMRYCSRSCAGRAAAGARLATRPKIKCEWCGKEVVQHVSAQRYCSRNCRANAQAHAARAKAEAATRESIDKVRAYLALPPAERWATRGTLTEAELKLAAKMHDEAHSHRAVEWNWLPH